MNGVRKPTPGRLIDASNGFTLIELLVVIVVIAILIALIIPAVMYARESAHRAECATKLKQLALAANAFDQARGYWPHGGNTLSPFTRMLPYLEQQELFNSINFTGRGSLINSTALGIDLEVLLCPSDPVMLDDGPIVPYSPTNYGGNVGVGFNEKGVFYNGPFAGQPWKPKIKNADVTDGLANTVALSEFLRTEARESRHPIRGIFDLSVLSGEPIQGTVMRCNAVDPREAPRVPNLRGRNWLEDGLINSQYNHNNAPNQRSCNHGLYPQGVWTASSEHAHGVNAAFMDGHVQFIRDSISIPTWQALGTINGREVVSDISSL